MVNCLINQQSEEFQNLSTLSLFNNCASSSSEEGEANGRNNKDSTDDSSSYDDEESGDNSDDEVQIDAVENAKIKIKKLPSEVDIDESLRNTLASLEQNFTESRTTLENELKSVQTSLQEILFMKDRLVRFENQYKSCIKSFDDKLHETQSNLDESNGKINDITSQIKKLQDQRTQLNNKQSQMKDEIENLKKENSSLKKELFIVQELVQKHENFIESISADSSPVTSSTHRDQISNHNQAPSQSPNDNPVQTTTSLLAAKQSTTISQELSQHQRSHNHDEKVKTNSVTLLIDSNGKQLQPNLLYPDSKPLICPTYTLQQLKDNINTLQSKPDILLIHCGTNDLEQTTPAIVIQETKNILTHAKSSFPAAKIIISNNKFILSTLTYSTSANQMTSSLYHINISTNLFSLMTLNI